MTTSDIAPLTCRLTTPELGARSTILREKIFVAVESRRELDNGFAFRFPSTAESIAQLADFIVSERECCPFFRFELAIEPGGGAAWLTLTGPAGTKEFILQTFV